MAEKMKDGLIKRGKTWAYVVREKDPATGRSRPRWVGGFETRQEAKNKRDEARNAVNKGTYVAPQDLTVAAYLDQWIHAHEMELKPSTAKTYRDKIRLYLVPAIGHERVQHLSPSQLSGVWRALYEKGGRDGAGVSVRTVEFARAVLRKAMEDAVIDRVVTVNPVVGSKMPKRDGKPKHTTWTGAQVQSFLGSVSGRWAPLWHLAVATGMRRGELMGLRWAEVDLDAGWLNVEVSTTQLGQERVTTTPKNHERRRINLDQRTLSVLRAWRKVQAEERLAWGSAYENLDDLVFTWENGRPVLPDYVTKQFPKIQHGLDLPRLTLHELRHTHATLLLRDGVPVHIVSKRLGHRDPSVTLDTYADVIPDDDVSAVDVFTHAVWGP